MKDSDTLTCQVSYPALRTDQLVRQTSASIRFISDRYDFNGFILFPQVSFVVNFDFNMNQLQKDANVVFEALR